jgi:EpsI family protein
MLAAAGLALALVPDKKMSDASTRIDLEVVIPEAFDDWTMLPNIAPVDVRAGAKEMLEETYDQIVTRTYVNNRDGSVMMISIAYGSEQTQELKAHRQEVCYAAQGFNISDLHVAGEKVAGREITVTRMLAVNNNRSEPVTYWFTVGDSVVQSRLERFLVQLKYAFTGYVPDGFLVRVSNLSTDKEGSYKAHIEFINSLLSKVPKDQLHRFAGALS